MYRFMFAVFLIIATTAQAETVNVFSGGEDNTKVIIRTTDDSEASSSIANRIGDNSWVVTDTRKGILLL